jgi:predicted CXXCH cytochrome family protein
VPHHHHPHHQSNQYRRLQAFAVLLLTAMLAWPSVGCSKSSSSPAASSTPDQPRSVPASPAPQITEAPASTILPPNDSASFVGTGACRECHTAIADTWQQHPMANSMAPATTLPAGSESVTSVVHGITRSYDARLENGRMLHRDVMQTADGQPVYSQEFAMDYVVGSGQRAHAWLRREGELLFQSPLNWFSQQACWDVAPGYQPDDPRRFRRRVTDDCISCHAGRPAPAANFPNRYASAAFHELAIGCERCHGPGSEHIEWHRSLKPAAPRPSPASHDPIVNPARLAPHLRESVCNQCHLSGSARIVRHGLGEFDFRPGRDLDDFWTVLHAGAEVAEDGTTKAVNHVQQMQESVCFKNSDGRLGCISCHDPHSTPAPARAADFYRQRCLTCHETAACSEQPAVRQAQQDSCIACHMPQRDSKNITHVAQTDHRVLRRTETIPSPAVQAKSSNAATLQLQFFGNSRHKLADWEQQRAMGAGLWAVLARKGLPAPQALGRFFDNALQGRSNDGLTLATLAALESQHGRISAARQHYTQALEDPVSHEAALAGLLDLTYRSADWEQGRQLAEKLLELDPGHPGCRAVLADCLWNLKRPDEALTAAAESLDRDPSQLEVRRWYSQKLREAGRIDDANTQQTLVARMESARARK